MDADAGTEISRKKRKRKKKKDRLSDPEEKRLREEETRLREEEEKRRREQEERLREKEKRRREEEETRLREGEEKAAPPVPKPRLSLQRRKEADEEAGRAATPVEEDTVESNDTPIPRTCFRLGRNREDVEELVEEKMGEDLSKYNAPSTAEGKLSEEIKPRDDLTRRLFRYLEEVAARYRRIKMQMVVPSLYNYSVNVESQSTGEASKKLIDFDRNVEIENKPVSDDANKDDTTTEAKKDVKRKRTRRSTIPDRAENEHKPGDDADPWDPGVSVPRRYNPELQ